MLSSASWSVRRRRWVLVALGLASVGGIFGGASWSAGATQAKEGVAVAEQVYKQTPQGELKLFVHYPPDWKATDRRPAIVFFFGGGWRQGTPNQFLTQAEYLAQRGMVAVRADYRVSSRHKTTPDRCVEDAKTALRWVRKRAGELGADPDRIAGAGGSAGAHLAACAALLDPAVLSDPADEASISPKPNLLVLFNPALELRGRGIKNGEGKDISALISPNAYLRKGLPATVMFFGTADAMLPDAREFVQRSRKAGNTAELYTAVDQPHAFFNRPPWKELTLIQTDRFLTAHGYLKGEPTLPLPAGTTQELVREP